MDRPPIGPIPTRSAENDVLIRRADRAFLDVCSPDELLEELVDEILSSCGAGRDDN